MLSALAACGGGTSQGNPDVLLQSHAVAQDAGPLAVMTGSSTTRSAAVQTLDATTFFNWAEDLFPTLFEGRKSNQTLDIYTYRYYPKTDLFLVVANTGDVLGLIGASGSYSVVSLGRLQDFASLVFGSGSTPYNECADPAAMALPTGFSSRLVYSYAGISARELVVETLVDGATVFGGLDAIKTTETSTITDTTQAVTVTSATRSSIYRQVQGGGLLVTAGTDIERGISTIGGLALSGFSTMFKSTYAPLEEDRKFTLKLGESVSVASKGSTTVVAGGLLPAGTAPFDYTTTFTYAARETVVVNGRSFDTCKYTVTGGADTSTSTTTWYLVGKGIPVKTETTTSAGSTQLLLKSGTYQGAAI